MVYGEWRVPWRFRVWRGKRYPSPSDLACKLLGTVPKQLTQGTTVIVLADTEFSTVKFFHAVRAKSWRIDVGVRNNRHLQDGRTDKKLYRNSKRGQQVLLEGLANPLTVSWFWLKRADSKRELRFVVSSYPY
ncbi:MAG: hypothetical protein DCF20_05220 [Pseudanabaena sp.]|nr:MAG: hypothetical protein DCF20_05220 [Pseudanabaena sp.]